MRDLRVIDGYTSFYRISRLLCVRGSVSPSFGSAPAAAIATSFIFTPLRHRRQHCVTSRKRHISKGRLSADERPFLPFWEIVNQTQLMSQFLPFIPFLQGSLSGGVFSVLSPYITLNLRRDTKKCTAASILLSRLRTELSKN